MPTWGDSTTTGWGQAHSHKGSTHTSIALPAFQLEEKKGELRGQAKQEASCFHSWSELQKQDLMARPHCRCSLPLGCQRFSHLSHPGSHDQSMGLLIQDGRSQLSLHQPSIDGEGWGGRGPTAEARSLLLSQGHCEVFLLLWLSLGLSFAVALLGHHIATSPSPKMPPSKNLWLQGWGSSSNQACQTWGGGAQCQQSTGAACLELVN